ncbi:MAG: hypothetical protein Ct9H300mP1_21960 [Planctomycetaceae bacterium]|nr:MAG: hypothetical protein Ct9H300mP1_21960 [Planctomycetaceae bacterium]
MGIMPKIMITEAIRMAATIHPNCVLRSMIGDCSEDRIETEENVHGHQVPDHGRDSPSTPGADFSAAWSAPTISSRSLW